MKTEENFLEVGDGHKVYFETIGKPDNFPILFIHGGPGYGFFPQDKRFFNPEHHFVILYDQRGCGRSLPYASIEKNTTQHLIQDIDLILNHFNIEKVCLFGGSWGSTLALLYAIKNSSRISRMILRGIFSAAHDTIDLFRGEESDDHIIRARKHALGKWCIGRSASLCLIFSG